MKQGLYKRNLLVPFLKMLSDALAVEAAILFSFWMRFYSPLKTIIPVTKGYPPFINYFYFSIFLVLLFIILFSIFQSYRSRFFTTFTQDIPVILKTCFIAILFAMSGAFLYREFSYSRMVFLLIFINANIFLLVSRFLFHRVKYKLLKKGYNVWKMALVGSAENLPHVFKQLQHDKNHNFEITGYFSNHTVEKLTVPSLGSLNQLKAELQKNSLDGLILVFNQEEHSRLLEVVNAAEGTNIEIFYVPDILDLLTANVRSLETGGIPLLQLKAFTLSGWQGFLKRTFDIVISFSGIIILSPLLLLLALLIKITSRGPVFYKQKRVGLDGREFTMLKFRSMYQDAESRTGPVWTKKKDPRVTPVGRILRRSSLDELPQLWNVLKGDMSLVGPRPERQYFVEQFKSYIPRYSERHRVRCGMTGWAQVNGLRGQSPIEERTRYDLYYIENWSLWFDIKIIIMTFIAIFRGENAY